jgi:hypothetical protein
MRARRPELFSDAVQRKGHALLTRAILDYQLESLTSRKQETDFEHFCRQLLEREICPNLRPQTGPTGGGDSKADAETYPVSASIAERWFEADAQEASEERWAFAFSAKEDWDSKVQGDVKKIAETNRGYKRIYFVSSRYAKDKRRAELEDTLSKEYSVKITILDRNWILDKVFTNKRQAIAVETLHLTGFDTEASVAGPRDVERSQELEALDAEINDPNRYGAADFQLVEDCLRSARLARGLERPRAEVEGRFERAVRLAEKVGMPAQQLRVVYTRAWTVFWWYDDYDELNRLYGEVEKLAAGTPQASDLEMLTNLWNLLHGMVGNGKASKDTVQLDRRTDSLKAELDRLVALKDRPNNALLARATRLRVQLVLALDAGKDKAENVLDQYRDVVESAETLGDFPLQAVAELIREFGRVFTASATYDRLFDELVAVLEKRKSEAEVGLLLSERGWQKLEAGNPYDAIKLLGRAQGNLVKQEYRDEMITALVGCGLAYERAGLFWAARMNILAASTQIFLDFRERGLISRRALRCVLKLIWLEIQLGRIPCVLCWTEFADAIAGQLKLKEEQRQKFIEERNTIDMVTALLLLRTPIQAAAAAQKLPDLLEQQGFPGAAMTLMYVLGPADTLRRAGWMPDSESDDAVQDLFVRLKQQPAKDDLPAEPDFVVGEQVVFRSVILGTRIYIRSPNQLVSIQLAEMLLGVLESFLATSGGRDGLLPHREQLTIDLRPVERSGPPELTARREGGEELMIISHPTAAPSSLEEKLAQRDRLIEIVAEIIPRFVVGHKMDKHLEALARDEEVFTRSLTFSDIPTSVENMLGTAPKLRLQDWEKERDLQSYPILREKAWDADDTAQSSTRRRSEPLKLGKGEPPSELLNRNLKHSERRVASLIDIPLWDRAEWTGTLYAYSPEPYATLYLLLGFRDGEAGKDIFKGLRQKLGAIDSDEQLRIAVITGLSQRRPFDYGVSVSKSVKEEELDQKTEIVFVARINRMRPEDGRNLNGFLERFHRTKTYRLAPAYMEPGTRPECYFDHNIVKAELVVRPAWQVGDNDPDLMVLDADDDPIIPPDVKNPPVEAALRRARKRRR